MFKSGSRYQTIEMNDSKIFNKLRIPLILFNDEYNKCIQNIDNLFADSLRYFEEIDLQMRKLIKENSHRKKKTTQLGTRAVKKTNKSQLPALNVTASVCSKTQVIQGKIPVEDKIHKEPVSQKRSAEITQLNESFKKIKYKGSGIIETPKSDKGTFKMQSIKADDANVTKNLPMPSKRTKPVVKSKFFDDEGNFLKPKYSSLKEVLPERNGTYSPPSSSQTPNLSKVKPDQSCEIISPVVNNENCVELLPKKESFLDDKLKSESTKGSAGIICDTTSSDVDLEIKNSNLRERVVSTYSLRSSVNSESSKMEISDIGGNETLRSFALHEAKCSTPKEAVVEKSYSLRSSANTQNVRASVKALEKSIKEEAHSFENRSAVLLSEGESCRENKERPKRTKKARSKKKGTDETSLEAKHAIGPVTRTKSKKNQEMERKSRISDLARKSLLKAKAISLHHCKLESIKTELIEEKVQSNVVTSLQSSTSKIMKLSSLQDSVKKISSSQVKLNREKRILNIMHTGRGKYLLRSEKTRMESPFIARAKGDFFGESASKGKGDEAEKELRLKALKEKEDEALHKKIMNIKKRQEELKERNERKLNSARKQRKKLESEKHNIIVQFEKEKEAKRKMRLQERELKMKENVLQKKLLLEKKLAETEERRRLEEEARLIKLKEQEAEQQRILFERQKELELQEKRAQERLADQKAREKYEMKLKEEQSKQKSIMSKLPKQIKIWNYKARNENDYGLEDENSELDSDHEERTVSNRPLPLWAKRVMSRKYTFVTGVSENMISKFMPCLQKTPDIVHMFNMTPKKRILRTSSAIWNTPSS